MVDFKIGDVVRAIHEQWYGQSGHICPGYQGVITHIEDAGTNWCTITVDGKLGSGDRSVMSHQAFELIERNPQLELPL